MQGNANALVRGVVACPCYVQMVRCRVLRVWGGSAPGSGKLQLGFGLNGHSFSCNFQIQILLSNLGISFKDVGIYV